MRQCDNCGKYDEGLDTFYNYNEAEYWWLCTDCQRHAQTICYGFPEPQNPPVPDPEPNVEPSSCDMFGHIWTDEPGAVHRHCVRCGERE